MLVKDIIMNNNFDVNCIVQVYDCTNNEVQHNHNAPLVYSSNNSSKIDSQILDMTISYITIVDNKLVIEASK